MLLHCCSISAWIRGVHLTLVCIFQTFNMIDSTCSLNCLFFICALSLLLWFLMLLLVTIVFIAADAQV